jgi:hypothetical protein
MALVCKLWMQEAQLWLQNQKAQVQATFPSFSPLLVLPLLFPLLLVLDFKLKSSRWLGRHSATWPTFPVYFCFHYFSDRIWNFFLRAGLRLLSPIYASRVARVTGAHHQVHLSGWDTVLLTFARAGLNLNPPDLCLPSSWYYQRAPPHPGKNTLLKVHSYAQNTGVGEVSPR